MLQADGYNVSSAGRGDEAIDMMKRSRFDIVLVDLHMTPVSGMEVVAGALEAQQGSDRHRHHGKPQRRHEHRGAAGGRVGLSPEAVLGDPPAHPDRARGAR